GHSNKKPLFYTKDLKVSEYSVISGKTGDHLKLFLRSGNLGFEAIGFGLGKEKIEVNDKISVAFYAERNNWNGNSKFQLVIKDFKN
ncbi:hypothetical protein KC660_04055, partial [Candidatus Dojkabacteria bacterium]|nr:hypothetical protein [Candidatus Dojkabacteria bacterium]